MVTKKLIKQQLTTIARRIATSTGVQRKNLEAEAKRLEEQLYAL